MDEVDEPRWHESDEVDRIVEALAEADAAIGGILFGELQRADGSICCDVAEALASIVRNLTLLCGAEERAVDWFYSSTAYDDIVGNHPEVNHRLGGFWSLCELDDWLKVLVRFKDDPVGLYKKLFGYPGMSDGEVPASACSQADSATAVPDDRAPSLKSGRASDPNIVELVDSGRSDEALALLSQPIAIVAATGPRSAAAALEAATRLFGGDLVKTTRWMSGHSLYLRATPCDYAERSDEDLRTVLKFIRQLEAGVVV